MSRHTVTRNGVRLSIDVRGDGPAVLMLASLGRGASDFAHLAGALAASGFRALGVDPRGVGDSSGTLNDITLHDLAADAAAVIEQLCAPPVHRRPTVVCCATRLPTASGSSSWSTRDTRSCRSSPTGSPSS